MVPCDAIFDARLLILEVKPHNPKAAANILDSLYALQLADRTVENCENVFYYLKTNRVLSNSEHGSLDYETANPNEIKPYSIKLLHDSSALLSNLIYNIKIQEKFDWHHYDTSRLILGKRAGEVSILAENSLEEHSKELFSESFFTDEPDNVLVRKTKNYLDSIMNWANGEEIFNKYSTLLEMREAQLPGKVIKPCYDTYVP